jgi:hypothetical protein
MVGELASSSESLRLHHTYVVTTMLTRTLLALVLTLLPVPAAAQHAPPQLPAPHREQGVTVTIAGHLLPSPSGALAVPLPLLERLAEEGALLAVDTAPVEGRIVVQARFGFADVAASSGGTRTRRPCNC